MTVRDWYPKNLLSITVGIAVAAIFLPVALLARVVMYVVGVDQKADRTSEEVAQYLRRFIDGTEGEWDLDDFESVPIKNEQLDSIRKEFLAIKFPMDVDGQARARELLSRVEAMAKPKN